MAAGKTDALVRADSNELLAGILTYKVCLILIKSQPKLTYPSYMYRRLTIYIL